MDRDPASPRIRGFLLALVLLGMAGLTLELLLLEHTETLQQQIPLIALGGGIAVGLAVLVRPSGTSLQLFRVLMSLFVMMGLLGLYFHVSANVAFELEIDPSAEGRALLDAALRGGVPAVAPGALAQLGLLGLLYTYRHPALRDGPR